MGADRPLVMGVINVTPDSFSDGGAWTDPIAARDHGLALLAAGADVLDVGGESTRPGATPVDADTECARVVPVIAALKDAAPDARIAVDTMKPAVAAAAAAAGARMWNDVSALRGQRDSAAVAAALDMDIVLMHMRGAPQTMQNAPTYDDVVGEVIAFLQTRAEAAEAAGVDPARLWVDPGVGFGKTLAHNLALMAALPRIIEDVGFPVLFGASRKSFIAKVDAAATDPRDRLGGSLAAALHAARMGASMIRVHDVRETVQALEVQAAITALAPS